jgi:DNA modification methylase
MILQGDCIEVMRTLEAESVHCCVTSPPYWGLRDYGCAGQIGLERTPEEYTAKMVDVFREVWRVLRDDGSLWLNLGDSYANDGKWGGSTGGKHVAALHGQPVGRTKTVTGLKPKDLVGIPWRIAFALQADGWYLRSDIIWSKPNPMPESVADRPTKAHEYIFLMAKPAVLL